MNEKLLSLLTSELGEIYLCEEECPGVYYLVILRENGSGQEYYLVLEHAPISQEAHVLGKALKTIPALVYPLDSEDGGRLAVKYEVLKYKTSHGLPRPKGSSLWETTLYGMELCPDYFGTYPVPSQTPWGHTLRHRPLDNGIYWIETDQCVRVLAICCPIWPSELSGGLLKAAKKLEHEDELGYLFFREESACVAIWELLRTRSWLTTLGLIHRPELMNAIWAYHPEYAMSCNAQEQMGLNEMGQLLYALGIQDQEQKVSTESMITMNPKLGTDFIGFWK